MLQKLKSRTPQHLMLEKDRQQMPKVTEEKDNYEHTLSETCCDVCKTKTTVPHWLKFENEWKLWFFCSEDHKYAFTKHNPEGLITLH